ncbi:hypothetical protein ACFYN0_34885 [Streptomyces sp. NPDC006704]|uniref:hypothetical protein n=1 Tax=Streptomyces sp. NPDC006704 TaxID=3364760 RepID=UPI0036A0B6E8
MSWSQALERAATIAAADTPSALRRLDHWDYVAIRGVVAVVLQAVAEQTHVPPAAVPLRDVQRHLEQGPGHVRVLAESVVGAELAHATDAVPAATAGDVSARGTWCWLTRTWPQPPGAPSAHRVQYDGMTRGIGAGHPGAAVDTVLEWAARAVECSAAP